MVLTTEKRGKTRNFGYAPLLRPCNPFDFDAGTMSEVNQKPQVEFA